MRGARLQKYALGLGIVAAASWRCAPGDQFNGSGSDTSSDPAEDAGSDAGAADGGADAGCDAGQIADTDSCGGSPWAGDLAAAEEPDLDPLADITHLQGSLSISGADIQLLDSLSNLVCIDGDLEITDCPALVAIADLGALASVGGNLVIGWNDSLETVGGLVSLSHVGGAVWLASDPSLTSASFGKLATVDADLFATDNALISNLDLPSLESVGGALEIGGCGALPDLAGLQRLDVVGTGIYITGNPALPTCEACSLVERLSGFDAPVCIQGNLADACPEITGGCR